ncbi:hypothetical protein BKI52_39540 [marine bacterium AO1-C]|nr:hypothetical protein BKI52_39540 [marine bacterium AO1-C]
MMTKIKSKFAWRLIHTGLCILLLFAIGMLIEARSVYLSSQYKKCCLLIVLTIPIFWMLFLFLKTAKVITISNKSIILRTVFQRQEILWAKVKTTKLHGKEDLLYTPHEATTLFLQDGQKHFFSDILYRNTPLLKSVLNTVKTQHLKNQPIDIENIKPYQLKQTSKKMPDYPMTEHSGNFWSTVQGWVPMFFVVIKTIGLKMLLIDGNIEGILVMLLSLMPIAFVISELNYYYLGKHHLVVRNLIWKPYIKVYHLDDIEEVAFDSIGHGSNGLRVITKDFKSNFFPAGSLSLKTWQKLEKSLKKKKIRIRPKYF